jgi:hypothetical protein
MAVTPTPLESKTLPGFGRPKLLAVIALAAPLAFQIYAVVLAFRHAPTFRALFDGLGAPLPLLTRCFLASYPYWVLVPLAFALIAADILRRPQVSTSYFATVLGGSFAVALALHAWLQEAVYAPLYSILDKVG